MYKLWSKKAGPGTKQTLSTPFYNGDTLKNLSDLNPGFRKLEWLLAVGKGL
jgi:hypothetical protein